MHLTVSMRLTNDVGVSIIASRNGLWGSERDLLSRFCDVRDSEYLFDSVVKTIWHHGKDKAFDSVESEGMGKRLTNILKTQQ